MYGHQLNSIDAKLLEVTESLHQSGERALVCIVVGPELVDDEVVLVGANEVGGSLVPGVGCLCCLQDADIRAISTGGIGLEAGVHGLGFVLIIGVQVFGSKTIGEAFLHTIGTHNDILIGIFTARL